MMHIFIIYAWDSCLPHGFDVATILWSEHDS